MIKGLFDPANRGPYPWVGAALYLPGYTQQWVVINFLIDTGAAGTCLHPNDAITRVGISQGALALPQQWPIVVPRGGIGGKSDYYTVEAHYAFLHSDTNQFQVIHGTIDIAAITSANQSLPSLLGWDILQYFKTTVDSRAGTVVLE